MIDAGTEVEEVKVCGRMSEVVQIVGRGDPTELETDLKNNGRWRQVLGLSTLSREVTEVGEKRRVFGVPPSSYEVQCCFWFGADEGREERGRGGKREEETHLYPSTCFASARKYESDSETCFAPSGPVLRSDLLPMRRPRSDYIRLLVR